MRLRNRFCLYFGFWVSIFASSLSSQAEALLLSPESLKAPMTSWDQVFEVIAQTQFGQNLLNKISDKPGGLPVLVNYSQLTPDEQKLVKYEPNVFARYFPAGTKGFSADVVVIQERAPLMAMVYAVTHELQHALDRQEPWYQVLRQKIVDLKNSTDLSFGLAYRYRYYTEVEAFRAVAILKMELEKQVPELKDVWRDVKIQLNLQLDFQDPLSESDLQTLFNTYITDKEKLLYAKARQIIDEDETLARLLREQDFLSIPEWASLGDAAKE